MLQKETVNKVQTAKGAARVLIAFALVIIITVSVIPFGMIGSFADNDSNDTDAALGELPEYNPSDTATSEQIKEAIDELKATLGDVNKQKDDLYLQLEEALADKDNLESAYMAQKIEADAEIRLIEIRLEIFQDIVDNYDKLIEHKQAEIVEIYQFFL